MASPNELLRAMSGTRFTEVLSASPKQFREELFHRAGIRAKAGTFSVKAPSKNQVRGEKLLASIQNGKEIEPEVAEELIRNYLYTRREMLGDALTHFGVPHDNGLTDVDLGFIDTL